MKRSAAAILAIALLVVVTAGGAALMYFSPRGVLNPHSPDTALQQALDSDSFSWQNEFFHHYTAETTPFEDAAAITEEIYFSLAGDESLTFREWTGVSSGEEATYILTGVGDFLAVTLRYEDSGWNITDFSVPDDLFVTETHTVTITVPSDAQVYVNGIQLDDSYIQSETVPYEDITELEGRFETIPHRICYAVNGLYRSPAVEVVREGGAVLQSCDGSNWSFMPPDAASHSFSVQAPADAVVTVNGADLTAADSTKETQYTPLVDIPEELTAQLPVLSLYEASGLYSIPEITAADAAGNTLIAAEGTDGTLVFTAGNDESLYTAHHDLVEAFIRNIAEYGAAHCEWTSPASFVKKGTPLFEYFAGARYSMIWIGTVRLTYDSITSYDYTPLGENAFLCKARLVCTSKTYHQTVNMDLEYEMLWENTGSAWQVADMAFTDNYFREKVID